MERARSVVITGAGSGIGRATALELAQAGMFVVVTGRRLEPLSALVSEIAGLGGSAVAHSLDVRDAKAVVQTVQQIEQSSGPIDVLVANAGIHDAASILDGDPDRWREVVETNVLGVINSCHAVLPTMHARGSGHILITSSTAGRIANTGEPVYVATKHATVGFAEALRQSLAPRGIKVTLIEPGVVDTAMANNPFAKTLRKSFTPLSPTDVARAIRFAIEQPPNCSINEILLRPTGQVL